MPHPCDPAVQVTVLQIPASLSPPGPVLCFRYVVENKSTRLKPPRGRRSALGAGEIGGAKLR